MRSWRVSAHVFFGVLIAVASGWGQRQATKTSTGRFGNPTSTARAFQDYIYGVVKKIDSKHNELTLEKTKFGVDQPIKLESKTKYVHDRKPSSLDRLKVGDQVYVDARRDKEGALVAKKVVTGVAPTE